MHFNKNYYILKNYYFLKLIHCDEIKNAESLYLLSIF